MASSSSDWKWNGKAYVRLSRSQSHLTESKGEATEGRSSRHKLLNPETVEILWDENRVVAMSSEKFFDELSSNYEVYSEAVEPMLSSCLQGVHGTIFTCLSPISVFHHPH